MRLSFLILDVGNVLNRFHIIILVFLCLQARCSHAAYESFQSSSSCIFDPLNPTGSFRLLDPSDGIPFDNINGTLSKVTRILEAIPAYQFAPRWGPPNGIHDILLDSTYLAIFDTGRIGFTNVSSEGPYPKTLNGESFVTTAFSVSCDGTISLQFPDDIDFDFAYHPPTQNVFARSKSIDNLSARDLKNPSLHSFLRRQNGKMPSLIDSWEPFNFLAGPLKVSDHYQLGYQPRCPPKPFGLESFVKPGARGAYFNGCGAENGMKVPDFRFTICCDNHDLCYDNCGMTWEECNENFRNCMHKTCINFYRYLSNASDPATNTSTWSEWGCMNLADLYADAVGTSLGAWAFSSSNYDRCDCACPTGTMNCTDMCLRDCSERCGLMDCSKETSSAAGWWDFRSSPTSTSSSSSSATISTTLTSLSTMATMSSTTKVSSSSISSSKTTSSSSTIRPSKSTTVGSPGPTPTPTNSGDSWWWPFGGGRSATLKFKTTQRGPGSQASNVTSFWWWPFY